MVDRQLPRSLPGTSISPSAAESSTDKVATRLETPLSHARSPRSDGTGSTGRLRRRGGSRRRNRRADEPGQVDRADRLSVRRCSASHSHPCHRAPHRPLVRLRHDRSYSGVCSHRSLPDHHQHTLRIAIGRSRTARTLHPRPRVPLGSIGETRTASGNAGYSHRHPHRLRPCCRRCHHRRHVLRQRTTRDRNAARRLPKPPSVRGSDRRDRDRVGVRCPRLLCLWIPLTCARR